MLTVTMGFQKKRATQAVHLGDMKTISTFLYSMSTYSEKLYFLAATKSLSSFIATRIIVLSVSILIYVSYMHPILFTMRYFTLSALARAE